MHDRQLYPSVTEDYGEQCQFIAKGHSWQLGSMLFCLMLSPVVVTFIHCKDKPRWISRGLGLCMQTWKHRCRILLAASEPVAYRLVLLLVSNVKPGVYFPFVNGHVAHCTCTVLRDLVVGGQK